MLKPFHKNDLPSPHGQASSAMSLLLMICISLTMVVMVPGCSGCRKIDETAKKKKKEEEEKKKKEKPKPDFEITGLSIHPVGVLS